MKIDKICTAITADIFATLGIKPTFCVSVAELAKYTRLGEFEISPQMCGPVAGMFGAIRVTVFAGVGESRLPGQSVADDYVPPTVIHTRYQYRYTHPDGGSNGYTLNKEVWIPE